MAPEHDVLVEGVIITRRQRGVSKTKGKVAGPFCLIHLHDGAQARLFFGQIDPNDRSHFSIRYEIGNQSGFIDGWLRDPILEKDAMWNRDKEWIELKVRDGPAFEDDGKTN